MNFDFPSERQSTLAGRRRRMLLIAAIALVMAVNGVAAFVAWCATHYQSRTVGTPRRPSRWSAARAALFTLALPRPASYSDPGNWKLPFTTLHYPGAHGIDLETWRVPGNARGPVVLMFPGYNASKGSLMERAREFHTLGCETWLVDFHGCGGSAGNSTTIGYDEAEDVAATFKEAAVAHPEKPAMVLYGTSMGAAAVLCAVHRERLTPDGLILECPYDRLVTTLGNRCHMVKLPAFPSAELVLFWGGLEQGFNGFAMNPVDFARDVPCPTLLMQGGQDDRVLLADSRKIAAALGQHGTFLVFPGAGHGVPVDSAWRSAVRSAISESEKLR